jgi:hypothetical protein
MTVYVTICAVQVIIEFKDIKIFYLNFQNLLYDFGEFRRKSSIYSAAENLQLL